MLNFTDGISKRLLALALGVTLAAGSVAPAFSATQLLNVSYDPTRELYKDFNAAFAKHWKAEGGDDVAIRQSHGGSGAQARSVIDGLGADVVTLALESDINAIQKAGKIKENWRSRLPNNSSPYTSTIVFLVRKGNPKGIKDWDDLVKKDVQVITPNPKTSGGARWNFLAAWAYAKAKYGSDAEALKFVTELYRHAPVLDTGARGATISFVQRQLGDVLIAWENEAFLSEKELGTGKFDIVVPSISVLAEPSVAVVDANAKAHGTEKVAEAYLRFLYTPEGQDIVAKNYYRPRDPAVLARYATLFPQIEMRTIRDFGGWKVAQARFFADGGVFDRIYSGPKR